MTATLTTAQQAIELVHSAGFSVAELKKLKISSHFTWAEVFKHRSIAEIRSCPVAHFVSAVTQAQRLEAIRAYIRRFYPNAVMIVSSWWRSAGANKNARGARGSRHLYALATDFTVPGVTPSRIQALLLQAMHSKALTLPFSLEITYGNWTHVDDRRGVVFENKPGYPGMSLAAQKAFIARHVA